LQEYDGVLTLVLDELALVVAIPESLEDGLIRGRVVVADECFQVLSGFGSVVYGAIVLAMICVDLLRKELTERHFGEELLKGRKSE
jgi:hypothetical protein